MMTGGEIDQMTNDCRLDRFLSFPRVSGKGPADWAMNQKQMIGYFMNEYTRNHSRLWGGSMHPGERTHRDVSEGSPKKREALI